VAVVRGAPVDGTQQIEPLDDGARPEVEVADEIAAAALVAGAEGVDLHRDRLRDADRVRHLDLRPLREPRPHQLPGDVAAEVGAAPVHLGRVLPAERAAAVAARAAVGVHDDLPPRHPGVGRRTALHEAAGRVHEQLEIVVIPAAERLGDHSAAMKLRMVLAINAAACCVEISTSVTATGTFVIVDHGDLRLRVRAQPVDRAGLPVLGEHAAPDGARAGSAAA
jgi:hypothetical protein